MSNRQRGTLSPSATRHLRQIAQGEDAAQSRRAQVILSYNEGHTYSEIASEAEMSVSGVQYWLKQFQEHGTALFGVDSEPAPEQTPAPSRRGRKPKAATPTQEPATEAIPEPPVPEPLPEPPAEVPTEPAPEPPKARRGRPPKPRPEPAPILQPELLPEPLPEPVAEAEPEAQSIEPPPEPAAEVPTEPAPEPPKARRGRPPKPRPEPAPIPQPEAAEPPPEPLPEPAVEAPAEAEPARPRRGRKPKAIQPAEPIIELPMPEAEPELPPPEPITSVTGLVNFYKVDLKHAKYVTEQAFILFDATAEIHRLPDKSRALLEAGALLHNVAYDVDQPEHHTRGRDIILDTPLRGFTDDERRMIALLAAFHRKKVHPEREPAFIELPPELRRDVLSLAAILRVADGCDNSLTQSTRIASVRLVPGELVITLEGENAEANAERVQKKSDLWEKQFDQRVRVVVADDTPVREAPAVRVLTAPPMLREQMPDLVITLDPAMSGIRALRKLAMHYTDRLDRLAAQVRAGEERRLPAMEREIERLSGLLVLSQAERFTDELNWLAARTHAALVAFTLHDRAASLADDPDDPNAPLLLAQLSAWYHAAQDALRALDFERYDALLGELRRELVSDPAEDSGALINTLVGPVVWSQLTELRDVMERGESVTDALTAARRLQDYLLYFRSLLGPEAIQALDMIAPFESYLAAIHTVQSILALLDPGQRHGHAADPNASEIVRNIQMETLNMLADGLPGAWASVNSSVFRRALALALATP